MSQLETPQREEHGQRRAHIGHGLMMIVCCIPMLLIAVVLAATGVAGAGYIGAAVLCTTMMAMMMRAMSGGHRESGGSR